MSKVIDEYYVCDSCGRRMDHEDIYRLKMKEFYTTGFVWYGDLEKHEKKCKIHLCGSCFKNLRYICEKKIGE